MRRTVLLAWVVFLGCTPTMQVYRFEAPERNANAVDLSGEWVFGEGAPPEGPQRVKRECGKTVTRWRLHQAGEKLGAVWIEGAELSEAPRGLQVKETAWGTVRDGAVTLESVTGTSAATTTAWRLTHEPKSQRLRGTRGDKTVWFAPLDVIEPEGCSDPLRVALPVSLEGAWQVGKGQAQPAATVFTEQLQCSTPAHWLLTERDGAVEAYDFPATFEQGVARREPVARPVPSAKGQRVGYALTLDGAARWRLRYDPESGHLLGTENGVAVWAVRRVFHRTCGPVP